MTWSARIEHTEGGLRLRFAAPTTELSMTNEVAAHLGSLLAIEARHRMAGVVSTLEAENACTSAAAMHHRGGTRPDRRGAMSDMLAPEIKPIQVIDDHPLCCDCDRCLNGARP